MFVLRLLPSFEAYKPAPGLAVALQQRASPGDLIVTYNVALPSLVYYLRRHIDVFYDHEPVLDLLRSGRPMYLMLTSYDYDDVIKPHLTAPLCRVSSHADVRREAEERALSSAAAGGVVDDEQM